MLNFEGQLQWYFLEKQGPVEIHGIIKIILAYLSKLSLVYNIQKQE